MSTIGDLWNAVTGGLSGDVNAIIKWAKEAIDWLDKNVGNLIHWVNSNGNWLIHTLGDVISEVDDLAVGAAHGAKDFIKDAINAIKDWVTHQLGNVETWAKGIVTAAISGIMSFIHAIQGGVTALRNWVNDHVLKPLEGALNAVKNWVTHTVIPALKNFVLAYVMKLEHDANVLRQWVNEAVSFVKNHGGWLLKTVTDAQGFLLWIARFDWHLIEGIFEDLLRPNKNDIIATVEGLLLGGEGLVQKELTAWIG